MIPLFIYKALAQDTDCKGNYDVILKPSGLSYNELELNKIRVALKKNLVPKATQAEKVEISQYINLIDIVLEQKENFFENVSRFAELVKGNARMAIISYKYVDPKDLSTQLRIPSSLLAATHSLEMLEDSNSDYTKYIDMLKKKSIEFAEKTLNRFPEEGRAYGQLAFVLSRTGGNKKEVARLFKRCIDLDQSASFCRDGYHSIQRGN